MNDQPLKNARELAAQRSSRFRNESDEYAKARAELLAEEIEVRRHLTRLAQQRQALPRGPEITQRYRFKDENGREVGLSDLFGKHQTLITYFWMYGPDRERPCPMCTNWLGGVDRVP